MKSSISPSSSLRLVVRRDDDSRGHSRHGQSNFENNLFVRLSPGMAQVLWKRTLQKYQGEEDNYLGSCWRMSPDASFGSGDIHFLPLKITVRDKIGDKIRTIYASFNGGIIQSPYDNNMPTIEMPESLLSRSLVDNKNSFPEYVFVEALRCLEHGSRVLVEPLTTKDWELLEIHSEAMEEGGLLNQISVVYLNQVLELRIAKSSDIVKMQVKEIESYSFAGRETSLSVWPEIVSPSNLSSENVTMSKHPLCVLLIEDTEVVITPKPRAEKKSISWSSPLRLIPTDEDWGEVLYVLSGFSDLESFSAKPMCILVNGDHWPFKCAWARVKGDKPNEKNASERIVKVVASSKVPVNHAVMNRCTRLDMKLREFSDAVRLKPCSPKLIAPDTVALECVQFDHNDTTKLPAWRMPDIELLSKGVAKHEKLDTDDPLSRVYPVGALFPSLSLVSERSKCCKVNCVRLVPRNRDESPRGCVVSFDHASWSKLLDEYLANSDATAIECTTLTDSSFARIRGPLQHVGSSDWIIPLVDRMSNFTAVQVQLSGSTGSGKTHSAILLSCLLSVRQHRPVFYLDCKKLQKSSAKMAGILGELDLLFSQAKEMENPVVILDDLDALSPNLLGSSESNSSAKMHTANPTAVDQSKLIADRISHLFEASAHRNKISLISTCGTQDSINPLLSKVRHFPFIKVKIPALLEHEQMDLLKRMIQRSSSSSDVGELIIANKTSGLLPRDLEKLTFRVARLWQSQLANNPINDVLTDALSVFTPLSQMQASSTSKGGGMVVWNDIGGLFKVKDKLESVIRHPILYRRIYERAQIRLPRGILLYGPPGCGKSIVIPALARECNYPIVKIRGPEIFDKYIGASEAKIRDIFERASQMAPSILFLDELEALAPRRGSDSTGVTDRVVNQLLTFLDGVEDASSGTVYIVGATSRPDKVDPAIIRPGRLERHLFVGPPENDLEWIDLLSRTSKHWTLTDKCISELSSPTFLQLVREIPRLSPADVRAAFDTAHLNAVHRILAETSASEIKEVEIDIGDLRFGFQETLPSLNETEATMLGALYLPFQGRTNESQGDKVSQLKTTLR